MRKILYILLCLMSLTAYSQGIPKTANRILPIGGRIFAGAATLIVKGTGNSFPYAITNSSGSNYTVNALRLIFQTASTVTLDYGDGTVKTYNTYNYSGLNNVFVITGNTYYSELTALCPIHYYTDGQNIERTVKISYNRANLTQFSQTQNMGFANQDLNFAWYAHPNLNAFGIVSTTYVTGLNLAGLTTTTNPALTTLSMPSFNPASIYYTQAPLDIFKLQLTNLTVGSLGYGSATSINDSKLFEIGNYPIKNTLTSLTLSDSNFTDTHGIPSTWNSTNLPALRSFKITGNKYTTMPSGVNTMVSLTSLGLSNTTTLTSYGSFPALKSLTTIDLSSNPTVASLGNFPTYFNDFTVLRYISYQNSGLQTESITTSAVNNVYDLITRNATISGANTLPFRGMTINLTVFSGITSINGTIAAPPGYVQGSSNGTPTTTGHKIFVMINQYGTTIQYTT